MKYDLIIRNGTVVHPDGAVVESIAIAGGKFVEIAAEIAGDATEIIDAKGLHLFPGVIDSHVHFNEPGREEWEGIATGSAAVAAGGGTCFFDMPLNSSPPVLDGKAFDAKRQAAEEKSVTDFGIWGGLTPDSLEHMEELAERGVVGFKAFMCDSGIEEFKRADDWTLEHGMRNAAKLGLPVAVHAENQELVAGKTRWMLSAMPNCGAESWNFMREPLAEAEAIQRAALFAISAKCALHIVHISNRRCVELAANFKHGAKGNISIETCPHYVFLNREDVIRLGAIAKCAPPLRISPHDDQLWERVCDGTVDTIGSDHSPSLPQMKEGDFMAAWGGISGAQSLLPALLTRQPAAKLERVAALTSSNVSHRFQLSDKGSISTGKDADLALLDLSAPYTLRAEDLMYRHKQSPFIGREFRGKVIRTIRRGDTIFCNGKVTAKAGGKLVRPRRR